MADYFDLDKPIRPTHNFPITESRHIKGGLRIVNDFKEMTEIPSQFLINGMLIWNIEESIFYHWEKTSQSFHKVNSILGYPSDISFDNGDTLVYRNGHFRGENINANTISLSYDELINRISNSELEISSFIVLKDYKAKYNIPYTNRIGESNQEELRLTATSKSTTSPNAISVRYPFDIINYSPLNQEFNSEYGKIIKRVDAILENEAHYDFRSIMFNREHTQNNHPIIIKNSVYYTFNIAFPIYLDRLVYRGSNINFNNTVQYNNINDMFIDMFNTFNMNDNEVNIILDSNRIYFDLENLDYMGNLYIKTPFNDELRELILTPTINEIKSDKYTFEGTSYASRIEKNFNVNNGYRDNNITLSNTFLYESLRNTRDSSIINSNNIKIGNNSRNITIINCTNITIDDDCSYIHLENCNGIHIRNQNNQVRIINSNNVNFGNANNKIILETCEDITMGDSNSLIHMRTSNGNEIGNSLQNIQMLSSNNNNITYRSKMANMMIDKIQYINQQEKKWNKFENTFEYIGELENMLFRYNNTNALRLNEMGEYGIFIDESGINTSLERIEYPGNEVTLITKGPSRITFVSSSSNREGGIKIIDNNLLEIIADDYIEVSLVKKNNLFFIENYIAY